MATITNLTSGIEIVFGGATTYIKHGNTKLLKRGNNLNIYDDSDDDGNQRGQVYITIPHSEVTSPVTADIDELYNTVRGYIDVSGGGGGGSTDTITWEWSQVGTVNNAVVLKSHSGFTLSSGRYVNANQSYQILGFRFNAGSGTWSAASSIAIRMAYADIDSGTQHTIGSGTQVFNETVYTSVGAEASAFNKGYEIWLGSPVALTANKVYFIEVPTAGFYSFTDVNVEVILEKV